MSNNNGRIPTSTHHFFPSQFLPALSARELSDFTITSKEDEILFTQIYETDQQYDQIQAVKYAESYMLPQDIRTLTLEKWIQFVKKINGIAANTLALGKAPFHVAGEYSQVTMSTFQETGIPGVDFEQGEGFSETNYKILTIRYGEAIANDYKNFFTLRDKKIIEKQSEIQKIGYEELGRHPSILLKLLDLTETKEFAAYQFVVQFGTDTDDIPRLMNQAYSKLMKKIQDGSDPYECAAFILFQHTKIHPFVCGNKRTARIITNTVLMMLGLQPVIIPAEIIQAMQQSTENNLSPMVKLLKALPSLNVDQPLVPHMTEGRVSSVMFRSRELFDDVTIIRYRSGYHLVGCDSSDFYKHLNPNLQFFTGDYVEYKQNPLRSEVENLLKVKKITGDTCYTLAAKYSSANVELAHFFASKALDLLESDYLKTEQAKRCRVLLSRLRGAMYDCTVKETKNYLIVHHTNSQRTQRYIADLVHIIGGNSFTPYGSALRISKDWLAKLEKSKVQVLAEELGVSEETKKRLMC